MEPHIHIVAQGLTPYCDQTVAFLLILELLATVFRHENRSFVDIESAGVSQCSAAPVCVKIGGVRLK